MKEPTEEQIKRFWEWCGWKIVEDVGMGWYSIDPITKTRYMGTSDPMCLNLLYIPIDLNNLFDYAMSQLDQAMYNRALKSLFFKTENPALTLFWALYKISTKWSVE